MTSSPGATSPTIAARSRAADGGELDGGRGRPRRALALLAVPRRARGTSTTTTGSGADPCTATASRSRCSSSSRSSRDSRGSRFCVGARVSDAPSRIGTSGESPPSESAMASGSSPTPESSATPARSRTRRPTALHERGETLDALLWAFAPERNGVGPPTTGHEVPASTPESKAMAKELKRRGFRFVGPTTAYALMQPPEWSTTTSRDASLEALPEIPHRLSRLERDELGNRHKLVPGTAPLHQQPLPRQQVATQAKPRAHRLIVG